MLMGSGDDLDGVLDGASIGFGCDREPPPNLLQPIRCNKCKRPFHCKKKYQMPVNVLVADLDSRYLTLMWSLLVCL